MLKLVRSAALAPIVLLGLACAKTPPSPPPATPAEPPSTIAAPTPATDADAAAVPAVSAAPPVSTEPPPPAPSASAPIQATPEPPPEDGFVVRSADGTCTWNASEYCCPPNAMCKPTPEPRDVVCPELAPIKSQRFGTDVGEYMEQRANGHCYTGPNPRTLHRTLCCSERYKKKP